MINLLLDDPQDLATSPDLGALTAAVLRVSRWTEDHVQVLDYVFRCKVASALDARAGLAELRALHECVRRAAAVVRGKIELDSVASLFDTPDAALVNIGWAARWRGYAAVLDSRIGAVETLDVEAVSSQDVVRALLKFIGEQGDAGVSFASLAAEGLANRVALSRALAQMTAHRLVETREVAGVKTVFLGEGLREVGRG